MSTSKTAVTLISLQMEKTVRGRKLDDGEKREKV